MIKPVVELVKYFFKVIANVTQQVEVFVLTHFRSSKNSGYQPGFLFLDNGLLGIDLCVITQGKLKQ